MVIEINNLCFNYGPTQILKDIEMTAKEGEITGLIGPNAAGKSTLLKCIAGINASKGRIKLDGKEIKNLKIEEVARCIGYLPQETIHHPVLTVLEVVLLGRLHSLSWRVDNETLDLVTKVLEDIGIEHLIAKNYNDLSGGEKQMVSIAQLLLQNPKVILMDEPTSNLDLQHQIEILEIIRDVTKKRKLITLIVIHDLTTAARYCDNLIIMKAGRIHSYGRPLDVLTSEMIKEIYNITAKIIVNDGMVQVVPICSLRKNSRSEIDPTEQKHDRTTSNCDIGLTNWRKKKTAMEKS
jgi:iron complex transport system ATP-binding protein